MNTTQNTTQSRLSSLFNEFDKEVDKREKRKASYFKRGRMVEVELDSYVEAQASEIARREQRPGLEPSERSNPTAGEIFRDFEFIA